MFVLIGFLGVIIFAASSLYGYIYPRVRFSKRRMAGIAMPIGVAPPSIPSTQIRQNLALSVVCLLAQGTLAAFYYALTLPHITPQYSGSGLFASSLLFIAALLHHLTHCATSIATWMRRTN